LFGGKLFKKVENFSNKKPKKPLQKYFKSFILKPMDDKNKKSIKTKSTLISFEVGQMGVLVRV